MIYTEPQFRQSSLDEFTSPLSDVFGAAAGEAWAFNPTTSLHRSSQIINQELGKQEGLSRAEPETSLLRPDEARQRVREAGLDGRISIPEDGIRGGVLDLLIQRHQEQQRRQDILARSPSGFVPGMAKFVAGFGASVMDPLNVASAFVPVVGEERYAAMLANAGSAASRAFVRAGVGAVEGAAGAALIEPIVYGVARQEQVDYSLSDTLANIAMGTVLGGGLHMGFGALADAARGLRRPVETIPQRIEDAGFKAREEALRTGVSQALTGRKIDVEALLPETGVFGTSVSDRTANMQTESSNAAPSVFGTEGARQRDGGVSLAPPSLSKPDNARLSPAEVQAALAAYAPGFTAKRAGKAMQIVAPSGRVVASEGKVTVAAARAFLNQIRQDPEFVTSSVPLKDRTNTGARPEPGSSQGGMQNPVRRGASTGPRDAEALQIAAANSFRPENLRMSEPDAVRQGEARFKAGEDTRAPYDTDALDKELALPEVEEDVRRVADALGVPALVEKELGPFQALAESAEAYGRAVLAAATCQLRRGA